MSQRIGTWFVGARGSVATTATVGALAIAAGVGSRAGCVAERPEIAVAGLPDVTDLVFGGHDLSTTPLRKRAEELAANGVLPGSSVSMIADDLDAVDARIRPGVGAGGLAQAGSVASGVGQRAIADQLEADLSDFVRQNTLDRLVVVDVSSTEPPGQDWVAGASLADLESALDAGDDPLPVSSLYAYAALRAGAPVVAFTPSPGPSLRALTELAEQRKVPWAGSDGKTGETLLKTVLAPMFAMRALTVRSWASYNMLGGGDGETLADSHTAQSKSASKARGLEHILGHPVDGPLHIDYVPDHGDWKTAMDHVSFEGFLGTRMSLQFTWTGCDSTLAAPLVLDLVRLLARAHEAGAHGAVSELGFFFKDPADSDVHGLAEQWSALTEWCARLGGPDAAT